MQLDPCAAQFAGNLEKRLVVWISNKSESKGRPWDLIPLIVPDTCSVKQGLTTTYLMWSGAILNPFFLKGVFAKFWEYWHQGTNPGHFLKKEHAGGPQRLWISFSWTASWQEKTGWMLDICISLSAGCTHWPWSPPFDTISLSCCHPIPSNWLSLYIVINITTESIFWQHNFWQTEAALPMAMAPFCLRRLLSRDVPGKLGLVIPFDITEDGRKFFLFLFLTSIHIDPKLFLCSAWYASITTCLEEPQVM